MKAKNSFTIHTELLEGTLDGACDIYLGVNSTCHLYVIPRSKIHMANSIEDIAGQPAFYILIDDLHAERPKAYIGHTTDFANRKNDHVQNKDFWNTAMVFISDNHKIYGDDVKFLEYLGINEAIAADNCELLNGNSPKRPNIAPYRINDMDVFFRDIQLLARFYGCRIFDANVFITKNLDRHLFYARLSDRPCEGKAYYDEESGKLVLMKGSTFAKEVVPSFTSKESRENFIADHCSISGNQITLREDVPLETPSRASGFILGRPSNGWDDWKDQEGKPLKEFIKRK